ncbi:MAG TPA: hypothetical protein VJ652_18295 [Noviherbaspirillum sp.]|nr:hypothetical protein [Noviherbaspirillum sp.]
MNRFGRGILASGALALALGAGGAAFAQQHAAHDAQPALPSVQVAQTAMALRDLWIGHVFWVRNVVEETMAGHADAAKTAENQVVANAKQIAAAIEPFYGKAASDKLFSLLAGHYGAVKQYLEATMANSKAKQDAAVKSLTDNAGEIATFLAGANPNLPADTLRGLLVAHGGHHIQQIQQLHAKQYAQEAQTWEAMKNHMYVISDALAGALAKQFPDKFK